MSEKQIDVSCPICGKPALFHGIAGTIECTTPDCINNGTVYTYHGWEILGYWRGQSSQWKQRAETAEARLAALEQQHAADERALRWIPVTERLPEYKHPVVCLFCNDTAAVLARTFDDGWTDGDVTHFGGVTHWMPLPEPPTDAK